MNQWPTGVLAAAWMQDALRQGFTALRLGRIDDAADCCNRVLGAKSDLPEGHSLRSSIYSAGQTVAADEAPDNPMFLVNNANNQMYRGNLEEAEQGLLKALAIDPASTDRLPGTPMGRGLPRISYAKDGRYHGKLGAGT